MSDTDLLREASDPTTPGERLRELVEAYPALRTKLLVAAARNPALPLDMLSQALHATRERWCSAAWHNPAVPLLLQSEPSPTYAEAACRLLRWVQLGRQAPPPPWDRTGSLAERIEALAYQRLTFEGWLPGPHTPEGRERWEESRALARHLASLFGLPWAQEEP